MEKLKVFFHGVKKEIGRVRWPNRKNMIKYSGAVLFFCFFFGVFFYAFFGVFYYVLNLIMTFIKGVL
jgi:preprotein translocase SecE subunit